MKRRLLIGAVLGLLCGASGYAQVGIGTTTPKAALDIESTSEGMLIPRVALTSRNVATPVTNPQGGALVNGTLVYNTATAGTSPNNVVPGFYYWLTNQWVAMTGGAAPENPLPQEAWLLTGNAGTSSATHFIGTTDNQDLVIRTNGNKKFTVATATNQLLSSTSGAVSSPSYSWEASPNYGFYMASGTNIRVATGGVNRLQFPNAAQIHGMADGTAALPFYSWSNAQSTGMFKVGNTTSARLGFSTNGLERMRITEAGNVGVATTAPTTRLEVKGALSLNEGNAIAVGATNPAVSLGDVPHSLYKLQGASSPFTIAGVVPVASSDGQLVVLQNTTAYNMTLLHDHSSATAANRIICPGSENITLRGMYSNVTLQYVKSLSRWIVISTSGTQEAAKKPLMVSKKGTTDATLTPAVYPATGTFTDMPEMSITLTPESSEIYLNFSASGDLQTTGLPASNHIKFRIVNAATNEVLGGAVSVSTDYDGNIYDEMVASGWSVAFNNFPITVTPNQSVTYKIQWSAVGIYAAPAQNHVATEKSHSHRTMSIIDYRN